MLAKIDELKNQATSALDQVTSAEALEQFRIQYLGSKGALKALMGLMKEVPGPQKRDFGQSANALKMQITQAFEAKKQSLGSAKPKAKGPILDITEPGLASTMGRKHVITQTIDELLEVFGRMGFDAVTGPEVEDEYHNFVALNIPEEHPARDPADNFYLEDPFVKQTTSPAMMRSQTSTVQIRIMEQTQPPVRIVSTGRVYRPDEHDATHYSMFHQVEGLYVDKNVNMVDLKTTLYQFARAMFGEDAEIELVPSYFPFTEPSAELYVKMDFGKGPQWMEIGGCGLVDPAVFEHVGYDPEKWTGFAFGLGIERLAMRKHNISDIRWLFENDVRFLKQF